jgi:hypothetical protein
LTISPAHYIVWITTTGVDAISLIKFVLQKKGDAVAWLGFIFLQTIDEKVYHWLKK